MKSLLLLRHGKSDWDADYDGDHERPLAPRGRKAAKQVGKFLTRIDFVPDLVLSSTATRAQTTFRIAETEGAWTTDSKLLQNLYHAQVQSILYLLAETSNDYDRVMLVGHEPTWSQMVSVLSGAHVRYPTAGLTRIDLMINDWKNIRPGIGELQWFLPPRLLKSI